MSRPCSVALTGGLASGKSTVAAGLQQRGAAAIDADQVVHQLYEAGAAGTQVVSQLFGRQVLAADGSVDRGRLGQLVLADTAALQQLNEAVHPLARRVVRSWLEALAGQPQAPPVALVEAALLIETGSYRSYDLLAVAWCQPEQQLRRAVLRGMDEDRARKILAAQMPLDEKRMLADVVIDTSCRLTDLEPVLDQAWMEILTGAESSP